jgi:hypothetical protein
MYLNFQEREVLRKSVQNFIVKNQEAGDAEIVNHYLKEGFVRSTIYRTIKRIRDGKPVKQSHLGKKSNIWTPRKTSQLKRLAKNKIGSSLAKMAQKFSVNRSTIKRKLDKESLSYKKRQKTPKYSVDQAKKSKKLSRKLVNELYGKDFIEILDDEKYFTFFNDETPGNRGFWTDNVETCPENVKYKGKEKIPIKNTLYG